MIRSLTIALVLLAPSGAPADPPNPPNPPDPPALPAPIPTVFAPCTLADALAKSKANNTIVVADFTAEWCAPCKMMERSVWPDARIEKWFEDHAAIALRIDTDKEPALRAEYAVSAWPTLIGFKHAEIIDRRLGSMSAEQLLMWLEMVDRAGKPLPGSETLVLPAPGNLPAPGRQDRPTFEDRAAAASALIDARKYDKATVDLLNLWRTECRAGPDGGTSRRSLLADSVRTLAAASPPARDAFAQDRARLEATLRSDTRTYEDLDAWLVLNDAVGDDFRTLAWFERVKRDPEVGPTFERVAARVIPVLERADRWTDLVGLIPDPIARLHTDHDTVSKIPIPDRADDAMKARLCTLHKSLFRSKAAGLYVGLLGIHKDVLAGTLASEAVKIDDTPAMRLALVEKAVGARQARPDQLALLDQAEKAGADVKELRKLVGQPPK